MNNCTISIFKNKTFFKVIKEIKLFSKYNLKHYDNISSFKSESNKENNLVIFFVKSFNDFLKSEIPSILIFKSENEIKDFPIIFNEKLRIPFRINDLHKKIVSLFAKHEFKKNSLINLNFYTIDKNERKIKRDNLELQLSEKEINFLVLFTKTNKPISRINVLKSVWKYSEETETHTIETHIHRLRKKIFEKFGDNKFIKNSNKGYYI
jgi:hypothetical protein